MIIRFFLLMFFTATVWAWDDYRDSNQDWFASAMLNTEINEIRYQVVFNTPDYIYNFYNHLADLQGMNKLEKEGLLQRKVSYSQMFLWFNIKARASSMEELVWDESESFYLMTDNGKKIKADVIGEGSYPRYRPIEVDGHIYDKICWEKRFGLRFPIYLLCEKYGLKRLRLVHGRGYKVLGTWNVEKLRKIYDFDDDDECY